MKVIVVTNNGIAFQLARQFKSVDAFHNFWDCTVAGSLFEAYPIVEGNVIMSDFAIEYVVKRNIAHLELCVIEESEEQ